MGQVLKMAKDSAARVEMGRAFHQLGGLKVILCFFEMAPRVDVHLHAIFWMASKSGVIHLGIGVQSQWIFCRQTSAP